MTNARVVTHQEPFAVEIEIEGRTYLSLTEGREPQMITPQIIDNDEFDRWLLLLSEAYETFRRGTNGQT